MKIFSNGNDANLCYAQNEEKSMIRNRFMLS